MFGTIREISEMYCLQKVRWSYSLMRLITDKEQRNKFFCAGKNDNGGKHSFGKEMNKVVKLVRKYDRIILD